jgi:hypothetical protein
MQFLGLFGVCGIIFVSANTMSDLFGTSWFSGLGISLFMIVGSSLIAWRSMSEEGIAYVCIHEEKFFYFFIGWIFALSFIFYWLVYPLPFTQSQNRNQPSNFIACLTFALVVSPFGFVLLDKMGKLRLPVRRDVIPAPPPPTVHDDPDFSYDPARFKDKGGQQ